MTQSNKNINKSQLFFAGIAAATIFKVTNLPDVLAAISGRDSYLVVLGLLLLDAALAFLIIWAYKICPEYSLKQILDKTVGKVAASIIMVIFGLFLLMKLYLMLETTQKFMVDNLYPDTTWQPFTFPVIAVLLYSAFKGLRPIARTTQIFGYFFALVMAVAVVGYIMISDLSNLLPIMGEGFAPVREGLGRHVAGTGDFLVFAVFLGRIRPEKGVARAMGLSVLFSSLIVLGFNACFWAFYERTATFQTHGEALIDMARAFRGSDTFARLDVLIVIGWIFAAYLNLLILNWATAQCFMDAFELKDSAKNRLICALPSFVILTIICIFVLGSAPFTYKTFGGRYKFLFLMPPEILIPLALPPLAFAARKKSKRKKSRTGGKA